MSETLKIAVLGAAESGVGAACLSQKLGHRVWLSDAGKVKTVFREKLRQMGLEWEEGGHTEARLAEADLIIKSPGIPETAPVMRNIRQRGQEVISEIEWAYRHCPGQIVAITGSNGKTTTTLLTHHLLKKAGRQVTVAGNVGQSFAARLCEPPQDYYVVEVSSFQLDDVQQFRPHIAILTNITPDHLDRYQNDMSHYAASKMKITARQEAQDYFIYCWDDPLSQKALEDHPTRATTYAFSIREELKQGAWTNPKHLINIKLKNESTMSIDELALQGKHNTYNSMASGLAGKLLGIRKEVIRESLSGFESVEHRLEPVLQVYGIQFINDSKATNVNSTWYALESIDAPVIWIAGGVDKGNDYGQLEELVKQKVKAIICLGADNKKLHREFEGRVPLVIDAAHMDEAVRMAYKMGDKGDTVLLSPACASFDLFENYEDRGRQFKEAVRNL